ncbi:putative entry exclusion protein TrbK-alt [Agrobacterium tumefaciens]|uniref:putative entry exclusion protein TrbK-alt n=1 Tax=Agrobacterium tumefaciens TaxID=358 RepID=UPI0021CF2892|nr:putative entry exclusion protein TrbK-alt [Agrobacterium tumefaciens]UXS53047.1 putative entry exclusion protein TrbK-alt [Agrobacterium tumefaciens]UXS63291.1 putative entry exclusion protein TrbK-alt [Agrobacterium tumefaciens]
MDLKIAARMIAVVAIGAGLTAAISALRHDNGPEDISPLHLRDPGGDPSLSVLARCRGMGMAALENPDCRKAWTETRRRFFGADRLERPVTPKPGTDRAPSP